MPMSERYAKDVFRRAGPGRLLFYSFILFVTAYAHLSLVRYAADDAYIHFRIAENFLSHGVPYYNTADALMSSSSSGWTVILSMLFAVTGVSVTAVSLLNSAATVTCAYVFSVIIRELTGQRHILTDVVTAAVIIPAMLLSSIELMETPFSMLLLGAGILLFISGSALSFLILGASVFFRPEFVVYAAVFAVLNIIYKKVPAWKMLVYALAGAAPFVGYNYWFFGTNIPHTVNAKMAVFVLRPVDVIRVGMPGWFLPGVLGNKVELIITAMLSYMTVRLSIKPANGSGDGIVAGMAVGGSVIFAAYLLKRVYVFEWYHPIYFVPVLASSVACTLMTRSRLVAAALVLACLPFLAVLGKTAYASVGDRTVYPEFAYNARVPKLMEVGERLYARYPQYSLMSSEVGGLGFGFKGQVYDGVGLVSRGALKYHPMKVPEERASGFYGSIPAGYVREISPDLIVSYDIYLKAVFGTEILDKYVLIREDGYIKDDLYAASKAGISLGKGLCVLIRKDRFNKGY